MKAFSSLRKLFISILILFFTSPCFADDFMDYPSVMLVTGNQKLRKEIDISHIIEVSLKQPVKTVFNSKPVKAVTNKLPFKKKKSKKIYFEDIKNNAPKTFDEYIAMSPDKKREDIKLPEPKYDKDTDKIDFPDPKFQIKKYNLPPGSQDIDLTNLISQRKVNSVGVISPDSKKMVYSSVYYYPSLNQTSSEMYVINIDSSATLEQKLKTASPLDQDYTPVLSVGTDELLGNAIKTLTLIDWSTDGNKIAVKEKIGSNDSGIWKTSLLVYNFQTKQGRDLNEIREAIRYWWKNNKNIDLIDYMWDIYPIGWDAANPNRIILYAYAFTSKQPKFLGTWSIDADGETSQLLSLDRTDFAVSINGLKLKIVSHY